MTDIVDTLRAARVAPVIRTASADAALAAVEVLHAEGFRLFEITLTIPGALDVIRDLAGEADLTVGVGTVLTPDQGRAAMEAGARFVVSPAFVPGLVAACGATPVALGAATPSEALRAHEDGAAVVKLFPAAQLGGPGFVKALRSVYPQITFMPTGGIGPSDIDAYLDAGAACLGMGGGLVSGSPEDMRTAARAVNAVLAAR